MPRCSNLFSLVLSLPWKASALTAPRCSGDPSFVVFSVYLLFSWSSCPGGLVSTREAYGYTSDLLLPYLAHQVSCGIRIALTQAVNHLLSVALIFHPGRFRFFAPHVSCQDEPGQTNDIFPSYAQQIRTPYSTLRQTGRGGSGSVTLCTDVDLTQKK